MAVRRQIHPLATGHFAFLDRIDGRLLADFSKELRTMVVHPRRVPAIEDAAFEKVLSPIRGRQTELRAPSRLGRTRSALGAWESGTPVRPVRQRRESDERTGAGGGLLPRACRGR